MNFAVDVGASNYRVKILKGMLTNTLVEITTTYGNTSFGSFRESYFVFASMETESLNHVYDAEYNMTIFKYSFRRIGGARTQSCSSS